MGSNTHIPLNEYQIILLNNIKNFIKEEYQYKDIIYDYSYSKEDIVKHIDDIIDRGFYKTKERALLNFIRDVYLNY